MVLIPVVSSTPLLVTLKQSINHRSIFIFDDCPGVDIMDDVGGVDTIYGIETKKKKEKKKRRKKRL